MFAFLRSLFQPKWPEGEPVLTPGGQRYGTRLPNGTILLADGLRSERLPEQKPESAIGNQAKTGRVQDGA
jgi:hypothetical protein